MYEADLMTKLSHPKHSFLAVYLLEQKNKNKREQKFGEYIDLLPRNFDSFPIFFKEKEELKWLEGSSLLYVISQKKNIHKHDYQKIRQVVPEIYFSQKEFSQMV